MNLEMPKFKATAKIDKSQKRLIVLVSLCTVITIFCLASTKALLDDATYHRHELAAKHAVIKQLEDNITKAAALETQYQNFNNANPNFIGGKKTTQPKAFSPN